MKPYKLRAFCVALFVLLTAQTPAPQTPEQTTASQAPPTSTKPFRHLEYSLQVEYVTNGEGHGSGMSDGGEGGSGSGVGSLLGAGGRRGTIDIDMVGFTKDGALIMTINEMLESAPRPGERFTCTVYGDGHVMCPKADGPLSDAENLVLSFLGRGFIDSSVSATNNHWQRNYEGKEITVVTDYTVTNAGGAGPMKIAKHSKITSRTQTVGNSVEDGQIVYDPSLSVPDVIHDSVYETQGSASLQSTFDLKLTTDSFTKP